MANCHLVATLLPNMFGTVTLRYMLCEHGVMSLNFQIFNGWDEKAPPLTSVCHTQNKIQTLTSSSPYMYIRFTSDQSKSGTGFKAIYSMAKSDCGGNFSTPTGTISSKNTSQATYEKNLACSWLVTVADQHVVVVNISHLDIDFGPTDCESEYLAAYDGDSPSSALLWKGCGEEKNKSLLTTSNKMFLVFMSNDISDPSKTGFTLSYKTGKDLCPFRVSALIAYFHRLRSRSDRKSKSNRVHVAKFSQQISQKLELLICDQKSIPRLELQSWNGICGNDPQLLFFRDESYSSVYFHGHWGADQQQLSLGSVSALGFSRSAGPARMIIWRYEMDRTWRLPSVANIVAAKFLQL